MFQSARLTLTAWYLLIIMLISITFSFALYNLTTQELQRVIRRQEFRQLHPATDFTDQPRPITPLSVQDLEDSGERLRITLVLINACIFVLAGGAGYFLAGRTLKPIKNMVDEQNRFITDASHELRTPLTVLRAEMEASLLEKNVSGKDTLLLIKSNLEEVIHLQLLSDNLLQLTNPQNKHAVFEKISLEEIMKNAIKKVSAMSKQKHIAIKNLTTDVAIPGDKSALLQLFINLLDNAIKYSTAHTSITITSETSDRTVSINFVDQGIGIDEKDLPHIFDRFYRVDKSRSKNSTSGYGLGLSIAKKIVTVHGGTITVRRNEKHGMTFIVSLPIA